MAIANELLVASYLQHVVGWTLLEFEPAGRHARRGDWLFASSTGRAVFVEVKTLAEPDIPIGPVFMRPDFRPQIRQVLARGYKQLPPAAFATLIVLVDQFTLQVTDSIAHGDVFQALFGQMRITFNVLPFDEDSVRIGPAFRDMFVHGTKHRRLGCVAGLSVSGGDEPYPSFYCIHNPFADEPVHLTRSDLPGVWQFHVDEQGQGREYPGVSVQDAWERIASAVDREASG